VTTKTSVTGSGRRAWLGPGYRVYFGRRGRELVLLLLGGDKGSQAKDIKRAKGYWASYVKGSSHGKTQ
jgi:putative addiction module killer protein